MKKIMISCAVAACLAGCGPTDKLAGNAYQLTEPAAVMPIVLAFAPDENRFYGQAVNNYFGTYTIDGQNIAFSPVGTTMMMGAPDEMAAERTYLQSLPDVTTYRQTGNTLTLTKKDGQTLTFQKTTAAE